MPPPAAMLSLVFLLGALYFTRATWWRAGATLLAGLAVGALGVGVDDLGYRLGLWWYLDTATPGHAPFWWYALAGPVFAGLGLIGWRIHRRYGARGAAAFVAAFAVAGPVRDFVALRSLYGGVMSFGEGAMPWVYDGAAWLVIVFIVTAIQVALPWGPRAEQLQSATPGSPQTSSA